MSVIFAIEIGTIRVAVVLAVAVDCPKELAVNPKTAIAITSNVLKVFIVSVF
jgi:hypothetical protein